MSNELLPIIICTPHRRKTHTFPYKQQTIADVVKELPILEVGYDVSVDDIYIPKDQWSEFLLSPNSEILCVPDFGDPGTIAAVALMVAAEGTALYVVTYIAISLAVSYGIGLAIQSLSSKPKKGGSPKTGTTAYSWNPQPDSLQGTVWPNIFGKIRVEPKLLGGFVNVSDSDDTKMEINLLNSHGHGPVENISDTRINNQPVSNYPGLEVVTRRGLLTQTVIPGFEKVVVCHRPHQQIKYSDDPYEYEVPHDNYDDLEIIMMCRCYRVRGSGAIVTWSSGIKIEIQELPGGGWETIFEGNLTKTEVGTDTFWKSFKLSDYAPSITRGKKYNLKFTKTSADIPASGAHNVGVDDTFVDYIQEIADDELTRPGKILVGITGIPGERFNGFNSLSSLIEGKIVEVYDSEEEEWVLEYSDNPGYIAASVLTQPIIDGDSEENYEVVDYEGTSIDRVNWEDVVEVAQYCNTMVSDGKGGTEKLITFNGIFDTAGDVWNNMKDVLAIARTAPIWIGNKVHFVTDKPKEVVAWLSEASILDYTYTFVPKIDKVDSAKVAFSNIVDDYKRDFLPVSYKNTAIDVYSHPLSLDLRGIVHESEAWRLGKFHLAQNELLIRHLSLTTEREMMGRRVGDLIGVELRSPNWHQLQDAKYRGSGRVVEYIPDAGGDKVILDYDKLEDAFEDGNTYEIRVRLRDGTSVLKVIDSVDGDEITIVGNFSDDALPEEDDPWMVGLQNYVTKKFTLLTMNRRQSKSIKYDLELIEYNDNVWDYDATGVTLADPNTTAPKSTRKAIEGPTFADIAKIVPQSALALKNIDTLSLTNIEWVSDVPSGTGIAWAERDENANINITFRGVSYDILEGDTTKEFVYWDLNDTPTEFQSTDTWDNAHGLEKFFLCRNIDGTAIPTAIFSSIYGGLIQAGTITAEFGQIGDLAVGTLQIADEAVTVSVSAYIDGNMTIDTTLRELVSASIDTSGGNINIICNVFIVGDYNLDNWVDLKLTIVRDSTQIHSSQTIRFWAHAGYNTIVIEDTPGIGSFTYYFKVQRTGGNMNGDASRRAIFLTETKK